MFFTPSSSSTHPSLLKSRTNRVFCHNLNPSHSLFIISGSLAASLLMLSQSSTPPPPSLPPHPPHPSSLHLSFSSTLSTLMDFTAGGHSGLLFKSSVSEMCVIFLLNWIICIYLPPSVLTPVLTGENTKAF